MICLIVVAITALRCLCFPLVMVFLRNCMCILSQYYSARIALYIVRTMVTSPSIASIVCFLVGEFFSAFDNS